jgi:peptidyl-prolyl cis-trans isomerase SurA
MKRLLLPLLLIIGLQTAASAQETRIAAVVNDDAISMVDLDSRIKLVFASSNLQDTPQVRAKLAPQVLRSLIDEKLEIQEAKRLSITVTDAEVDDAIGKIEAQNHLQKGGLDALLAQRGVDKQVLRDQLTATLLWGKVIRRKISMSGGISEEEIDEAVERQQKTSGQPQSRVAEIVLNVDVPQQEEEVHRAIERLYEQLKGGADFARVAQQFSESATAAVGGDIGWVTPDQLGEELGQTVRSLNPGEMSAPVRGPAGWYLLLLIDRRAGIAKASADDTNLSLVQVMFPVAPDAPAADREKAKAAAEQVSATAKSCGEMVKMGQERAPQTSGDLGHVRLGDLPPDIKQVVADLPVAQTSPVVPLRGGIGVLMVCQRDAPANGPNRDDVADELARQRFESVGRRYLRDLRRTAFVDVRA